MWVSKRLDLSWPDLAFAGIRCLSPRDRNESTAEVEAMMGTGADSLACLSVRSGFDLFLAAHAIPAGSDIVFSALTVADMPRIAREHGLHPVACDVAPGGAAPRLEELERACTPATRVVVLAHLFGSRMETAPLVQYCRNRGILVVEDCAQAYAGPDFTGHPDSDAVFFSFGPIKHATALGGAIALIRDPDVRGRMRAIQDQWPEQTNREYLARVLKYSLLHALSARPTYTLVTGIARVLGMDVDKIVNRLTRSFPGAEFFRRIRRRPSTPLLSVMARRLGEDVHRFATQETRVHRLLTDAGALSASPSSDASPHSFWLVPIVSSDPDALMAGLKRHGFDATRGRSFEVVEGGPSTEAARLHDRAVYIPVYREMSDRHLRKLTAALEAVLT